METSVNYRLGHRARVKERFLRDGIDCFAEYEILELLLFYAVPRRDTKGMAHALMDAFSTLYGVLTASEEELCSVDGIGPRTASFLRAVLPFMHYVAKEEALPLAFLNKDEIGVFFVDYFKKHPEVSVAALFMSNRRTPIRVLALSKEDEGLSPATAGVASLISEAFCLNAPELVVAYRKKDGIPFPTSTVSDYLRVLEEDLAKVGIALAETVCVVGTQYNLLCRFMSGSFCRVNASDAVKDCESVLPLPSMDARISYEHICSFFSTFMRHEDAEKTARAILDVHPTIGTVLTLPYATLQMQEGIGDSASLLLKLAAGSYARAMLSLALRRAEGFCNAQSLGALLSDYIGARAEENMALAMFDENKRLLGIYLSGVGTVNVNLFVQRKLLQEAVRVGAKYVALSHNHPLGDVTPSSADQTVTEEARRIFDAVGIVFLDHFVVNERDYYPILYHRGDAVDARKAFFYGEK